MAVTETAAEARAAGSPSYAGLAPSLTLSDARAAADFYKRAFAAVELDRRPTPDGRLMHCMVQINGAPLMFNDGFPEHGHPAVPVEGVVLTLMVEDIDGWWGRAVEAGAEVTMPLQKMFWGDRYGQLKDPFGVVWAMNGPAD